MDLALLIRALGIRDGHESPEVRALTDRQVIDIITTWDTRRTQKTGHTRYADPTGDQATAQADRRRR